MRIREVLYILRDNNDNILAISEDKDLIIQYINQFYEYLKYNNTTIEKETDKFKIRRLLDKYISTATIHAYSEDIILTEYEYNFYNLHFRKIYDEFKTTITSLLTFKKYMRLSESENNQMDILFKCMYNKCYSFDEFLKNINPEFIFKYIITDPLMTKSSIKELELLMDQMSYNIIKDKEENL